MRKIIYKNVAYETYLLTSCAAIKNQKIFLPFANQGHEPHNRNVTPFPMIYFGWRKGKYRQRSFF